MLPYTASDMLRAMRGVTEPDTDASVEIHRRSGSSPVGRRRVVENVRKQARGAARDLCAVASEIGGRARTAAT